MSTPWANQDTGVGLGGQKVAQANQIGRIAASVVGIAAGATRHAVRPRPVNEVISFSPEDT